MLNNPASRLARYCALLVGMTSCLSAIAQAEPVTDFKDTPAPAQAAPSSPAPTTPTAPLLELPAGAAVPPAHVSSVPSAPPGNVPVATPAQPPSEDTASPLPQPAPKEAYKPKIMTSPLQPDQPFLEEPVRIEDNFSIMFSQKDMDTLIIPSLALYDKAKSAEQQTAHASGAAQDDLTDLLASLTTQGEAKETIKPLPNLYLGSIVYYTPSDWSIWINGRKLPSRLNKPENEFFVREISRTSAVVIWKPQRLTEMQKAWTDKTTPPHVVPKSILLDEEKKTVTLTMRPNQTFIPLEMSIEEGLIKAKESTPAPVDGMASPNVSAPTESSQPQPKTPAVSSHFSRKK